MEGEYDSFTVGRGSIVEAARLKGRTLLTEHESKQVLTAYDIPTVETCVATTEAEAVEQAERIGYPVVLKLHSETITHKTDVGGVQLNLADAEAVRRAFQAIERSVLAKARQGDKETRGQVDRETERQGDKETRRQGDKEIGWGSLSPCLPVSLSPCLFGGVTVQPMVKLEGYEIILGSSIDPQFGPVLLFGTGGQLVEVFKDRALGLPPLTTTLAHRLIEQTRIFTALKGVRGRKPIDPSALEQLLVNFSRLVVEQRWIKEIDINPLLVSPERIIALDARMVLHGQEVRKEDLPELAIRPYPTQYVGSWKDKDGETVTFRPIRPEDEPLLVKFHSLLSEQSVYLRYLHTLKLSQRVAHERLARLCFIDYDRELALVAEHRNSETGEQEIMGVGRLIKQHGEPEAEFALLVADAFQKRGLGTELLRRLLHVAREERLQRVVADILSENLTMQRVCRKLGFNLYHSVADRVVNAVLDLRHGYLPTLGFDRTQVTVRPGDAA